MKRVVGLGGIFIKSKDPKALYEWYRRHLGIESSADGSGAMWAADHSDVPVFNVWAVFPHDSNYFAPSQSPFMINFRVDDLDALLKTLREEGVQVDDKVEDYDYGKFGWIVDPEGNRVELWEPKSAG
jgi:predicted enzyme related to lactoylglutathione lyase